MTEIVNNNIEISLGWLSCTVPREALNNFYSLVMDVPVDLDVGFRGYERSAIILGSGRVGWSVSRPEAHIDLSASALGLIKGGEISAILDVIGWVLSVGGHDTRLDISFDDRSGLISIGEVERALSCGDAVTYWRKWNIFKGSDIGQAIGSKGETVYIGSKASEAFLRIYNKALERNLINTHWTRFELQLRDKLATGIANVLYASWKDKGSIGFSETALGLLRGFIEFKDFKSDINPTRRVPLEWWAKFVGDTDKARIVRVKTERSLERTRAWIERQVSPALGVIHEVDGSLGWVDMVARDGKKRWRAGHLAMLK